MFDNMIRDNQIIECPKCHLLALVREFSTYPSGAIEGYATCRSCVGGVELAPDFADERTIPSPYPLDFAFRCDNLNVTSTGGGTTWCYTISDPGPETVPEPEVNEMNKVWVARHREAKNLILGVFTDHYAAKAEYDKLEQIELVAFDCKHASELGENFPIWIVSVGKDKAFRIVSIFTDEKQAAKIASSIGGRVQATDAIPQRRQRRTIHVYKSWVVLGDVSERWTMVDEINVARKLFPGEEDGVFPIATFRRVYDRNLPHRIEILALDNNTARDAAKDLAELTDEEMCVMLEYNVDYKLIQTDGKWGVDPCLLNQPV